MHSTCMSVSSRSSHPSDARNKQVGSFLCLCGWREKQTTIVPWPPVRPATDMSAIR